MQEEDRMKRPQSDRLLAYLRGHERQVQEIAAHLDSTPPRVNTLLAYLMEDGIVRRVRRGVYAADADAARLEVTGATKWLRARRAARHAAGLCACGERQDRPGRVTCSACAVASAVRNQGRKR
jgi:DNA-binding transcriptional ArsR family regulator